ncbi:MAG: hypothetical protein M0R74_19285 [Dehalococcoidia bacterium]|nr:hypothetical protein [Dehalococcoidia bacterium]
MVRRLRNMRRPHLVRAALTFLPVAAAAGITAIAATAIFPPQPGVGIALAGLAWLGAGAALAGRTRAPTVRAEATTATPLLVDPETGVGTAHLLDELLHREIARSLRHAAPLALALFEIEVTGFRPAVPGELPPSPAPFVARVLVNTARESDFVVRLDRRVFALILVECEAAGGEALVARVLTQLSREPYARNADGTGIFVRAAGAATGWRREFATPGHFLEQARLALGEYGRALSVEHSWFAGRSPGDALERNPREPGLV